MSMKTNNEETVKPFHWKLWIAGAQFWSDQKSDAIFGIRKRKYISRAFLIFYDSSVNFTNYTNFSFNLLWENKVQIFLHDTNFSMVYFVTPLHFSSHVDFLSHLRVRASMQKLNQKSDEIFTISEQKKNSTVSFSIYSHFKFSRWWFSF